MPSISRRTLLASAVGGLAAAIGGRLPDVGWGPERVSLAVVVGSDGTFSARVEPRSAE